MYKTGSLTSALGCCGSGGLASSFSSSRPMPEIKALLFGPATVWKLISHKYSKGPAALKQQIWSPICSKVDH